MTRQRGRLLFALVALGTVSACLEIDSVEQSAGTGGSAGQAGDAAAESSGWPDGAGGEDAPEGASSDASDADVGDDADAGTSYATEVLKDGPELYWRLDELTGPTITDSSGKGNHGKYLGATITYGVTGALKNDGNTAVSLAGGYFEAADLFDFVGNAPFSFEIWFRPNGVQTDFARLVSKERVTSPRTGWTVFLDDSTSPALKAERWRDGSVDVVGWSSSLVSTDFRHIVATYDGVQLHLYVDGVEVAAATSSLELADTTNPLRLAAVSSTSSTGANKITGAVDEVAIYPHALSAARISAHYEAAGY